MLLSPSVLRSTLSTLIVACVICPSADAQLFRRSGDDQATADRNRPAHSREGKSPTDSRSGNAPGSNMAGSNAPANRGANIPANRSVVNGSRTAPNSTPQSQPSPNVKRPAVQPVSPSGNATRSSNPNSPSPIGSGVANRPKNPPSRPQNPPSPTQANPGSPRAPGAPTAPSNNLLNQFRSSLSANPQAVPQPPASFGHQPVSQPTKPPTSSSRPELPELNNGQLQQGKDNLLDSTGSSTTANANAIPEAEIFNRFGMQLSEEAGALWVSSLKPNGNGQSAGLNRKDKVLSLGGAPLSSNTEFLEIAKLLSVGDQIEIEFERDGDPQKAMILYGQAVKEQSSDGSIQLEQGSEWTAPVTDPTQRLEQLVVEQQRVIAELQNRIRQLEAQTKTAF